MKPATEKQRQARVRNWNRCIIKGHCSTLARLAGSFEYDYTVGQIESIEKRLLEVNDIYWKEGGL